MTQLVIHDRVTSVHEGAFGGCFSLTSITVDQNNKNYKDIDGNLYSKDGKTLVRYALGKKETSFVIPSGVECIGQGAFSDCRNLINVWISNNLINIGDYAFLACISLDDVKISDGVQIIGKEAFRNCASLTSIEIPNSVTSMGDRVFYNCISLKNVTMPDNIVDMGDDIFIYCKALKCKF